MNRVAANGSMERMNQLLSAAHILNCEASCLIDEANDLMNTNGLKIGLLKKLHSDLIKSSDRYFKEFASMVCSEKSKMDMFSDLDAFDESFRKWAKIPVDWKPQEVEE